MFYDRKMKYLEYRVNGEKVRGVGFVKLNVLDELCSIQIHINGLPMSAIADGASVEVLLSGRIQSEDDESPVSMEQKCREVHLASLMISEGKADYYLENMSVKDMLGMGISYQEIVALRIPLDRDAEVYCVLGEGDVRGKKKSIKQEELSDATMKTSHKFVQERIQDIEQERIQDIEQERIQDIEQERIQDIEQERIRDIEQETAWKDTSKIAEENIQEINQNRQSNGVSGMPVQDSKWKQLWALYPHIRPFQDEREYLSLGPNDFVILAERYFKLIQNSFLLHGYYNYNHLILQRIEQGREPKYYIGVPGNFYDREKQIAVMFGFESFECFEEPAGQGDYGYYMIQVEL